MAHTNTLGGYQLTQIAQETIEPLMVAMAKFNAFTTNFSDEVAREGAAVSTRLPTMPTFGSLATGYSANVQNATTTVKTCTLGAVTGAVLGFTDAEWTTSSINLHDIFIRPLVNGVANDAMDDLLALVLNATYSGKETVTADNFDSDTVSEVAYQLTNDNVPYQDRTLMLTPDYVNSLRKDNALLANTYGGTESIRGGTVPRLMGFNVIEYNDIPSNSENLKGFGCGKTALLIAARPPAVPANFPGEIANVTDPESGFTLQLRSWYSADDGKYYLSGASMWGVAAGDGSALHRIVSA
jgi:hypothetical protein